MKIKIGTRSSPLALWQAEHVADLLRKAYRGCDVELVKMSTKGDRVLEKSLAEIGGKGLFTEELEKAMLEGHIDLAVHSLKDMPTDLPKGLMLGAFTKRENPQDVLVSPKYGSLANLPQGAKVGTSSLRRKAQLLRMRPDLSVQMVRGNVQTRLTKLDTEGFDALLLAYAGLKRLGLTHYIHEVLSVERMLPAVGQGVLAIECKQEGPMMELLAPLRDEDTYWAVMAERSFLRHLHGGCQVPIGVFGQVEGQELLLRGLIASLDGTLVYEGSLRGSKVEAESLGVALATELLTKGAQAIVDRLIEEGILK